MRLRERKQRYLRGLRGEKKAVSPVVATLILILIAVAAAAALYLWLVAWQGSITGGIGTPTPQTTVTIGGSTSVYPFDQLVVNQFEQNTSDVTISDNQGGSGAGMIAVCSSAVDIGATSALQTVSNLQANYACPQGGNSVPVITTVAYDGVDIAVQSANPHGLVSISADTMLTIYVKASSTGWTGTSALAIGGTALTAVPLSTLVIAPGGLAWDQIPACVTGTVNCGGAGNPTEDLATGLTTGPGIACIAGIDTCATGAGISPCGFAVCAGPVGGTGADLITTVTRSDPGGTVQSFTARILGISGSNPVTSLTSLLGNWGGCGSDGQLGSCGITADVAQLGNPGVISYIATHSDALGFASDGLMRVSSSGTVCAGVATSACGIGFEGIGQTTAIQPSLGSSGTIASSIKGAGMTATTGYAGWRPFQWVTLGQPTGEVQRLLQFAIDPYNNQNLASEANEISIYQI